MTNSGCCLGDVCVCARAPLCEHSLAQRVILGISSRLIKIKTHCSTSARDVKFHTDLNSDLVFFTHDENVNHLATLRVSADTPSHSFPHNIVHGTSLSPAVQRNQDMQGSLDARQARTRPQASHESCSSPVVSVRPTRHTEQNSRLILNSNFLFLGGAGGRSSSF